MSDWQSELDARLRKEAKEKKEQVSRIEKNKESGTTFVEREVWPAFGKVGAVLQRHGRKIEVKSLGHPTYRTELFHVVYEHRTELRYSVEIRVNENGAFAHAKTDYSMAGDYAQDVFSIRSGEPMFGAGDPVSDITQDEVTQSLLKEYEKRRHD